MNNIKEELIKLSDEKYRKFNEKLCPDTGRKMLGIKVPVLREFSKKLLKENTIDEVLKVLDTEYFEEVMVRGFVISYCDLDYEEKLKYIKDFVPHIDSWAVCDSFVPSLKIKNKDKNNYYKFIKRYLSSDKEFYIRFGIISLLDYYIIDEYVDDVINLLDSISHDGYYVKMGEAWCLCEIGIKYYDKFIKYMRSNNNLDNFTFNKTIQKMIDSYRVDDVKKDELRSLRRK